MAETIVVEDLDQSNENAIPQLAHGVTLCGEYEGGGYEEPRYLVARGDGQMALLSELLYQVSASIDGRRNLHLVADEVSRRIGKRLSVPGVQYLVEDKLHPLGIASLSHTVAEPPRADPLLALVMHGVLVRPRAVRAVGALLAPLFRPLAILLMLAALVAVDVWLVSSGHADTAFHASVGDPAYVLTVIGLMVASTLFHEFGHAAGCHYGGGRPGAIGVGILLIIPCFFTNVTDAYRLDRRGRLRTDLGGVYFNAIFIVALGIAYAVTLHPPLLVVIALSHLQMLQQMLPLIRMDGYYILGDLVGVPNLFSQIRPMLNRLTGRHRLHADEPNSLRPRVRIVVTLWVSIVVPTLCAALLLLLARLPEYLSTAWTKGQAYIGMAVDGMDNGQLGATILAIVSVFVLLLPWLGGVALLGRTIRKGAHAVRRRHPRKPPPRHRQQVMRRRHRRPAPRMG